MFDDDGDEETLKAEIAKMLAKLVGEGAAMAPSIVAALVKDHVPYGPVTTVAMVLAAIGIMEATGLPRAGQKMLLEACHLYAVEAWADVSPEREARAQEMADKMTKELAPWLTTH